MKGFALVVALVVIAVVAATSVRGTQVLSDSIDGTTGHNGVKIDLDHLLRQASTMHNTEHDIEEDPDDRFITKRGGALRNLSLKDQESSEWAEESGNVPKGILSRQKRCPRDDDDDDGDANRARFVRKRKIKKGKVDGLGEKKWKVKKSGKKKTTTVTVIQNGQVVSQTKTTQKPVVQKTTTTTTTTTTSHAQPQVQVVSAVHQVAPVVHHQTLPVVQQAAPIIHQAAPVVYRAAPSVIVQPQTTV